MILKANRFHGYGSLKHVYRGGTTARGPMFAVKALSNPRRQSYRVAVVVSRKVSKSAVKRNLMRRRLYAAVRLLKADLKPYDVVISVFNDQTATQPYELLQSQLKKQLQSVGVIDKP